MSQWNKKIGDRKSDLLCIRCEKELKWVGSVMEGKMLCQNVFCMEYDSRTEIETDTKKAGESYVYQYP